ncbi:MAG: FAD-dependent oxidoreductase [Acidobacteriota bacterium]|nr:FAD-dependent oxidoreductase [Acidobacteriota bacterium]
MNVSIDLTAGVAAESLANGAMLAGHVGEDEVVLVRSGDRFFAIGAHCTHYGGPLAEGLVAEGCVRCPWHHASFDLETGEAVRAPALNAVTCWRVERRGETVFVREKISAAAPSARKRTASHPRSVVIIGGGAAGLAAAEMLRREAYQGQITIISADVDPPVDRPNLSKDYLSGQAQDEWIPLWPAEFYAEKLVELTLSARAKSIDSSARTVELEDGSLREYGALLIATGAEPVHLPIPGADTGRVFYLRTFADSRAIVERARSSRRAVVIGASFIGLEVAASLRTRGLAVDVVAPEQRPLGRVMGAEIGKLVQTIHEEHGVVFHLGETVKSIAGEIVTLSGGNTLQADFVVVGAGVRPSIAIAERSGLTVDRGIVVNEFLETNAAGVYAAGDAVRWPDPHTGEKIRVEHWVLAERMGQTAAKNILGARERFDAVPFFWSQHYDVNIRYVGHAERWDAIRVDGSLEARDASVSFVRSGRTLAVASISRDRDNLKAEVELERIRTRGS